MQAEFAGASLAVGPPLDQAVAIRLMDWDRHEVLSFVDRQPMYRDRDPFDHWCSLECEDAGHALAGTPRAPLRPRSTPRPAPYSTDLSVAWTVRARVTATWQREMRLDEHAFLSGVTWVCRFVVPGHRRPDAMGRGGTAAEAICRAALALAALEPRTEEAWAARAARMQRVRNAIGGGTRGGHREGPEMLPRPHRA